MKCVILAGGSGDSLWPLSRKNFPKQFMNIKEATEKEEAFITIREDYTPRKKVLNEIPLVSKSIRQSDGEALTGNYTISANGLYLNDLSSPKLKEISVKLEEFLESVDKQW